MYLEITVNLGKKKKKCVVSCDLKSQQKHQIFLIFSNDL